MTNKKVTIKNASDEEIEKLIYRLRRENELQELVARIKRISTPEHMRRYEDYAVSTEEPIDSLYHITKDDVEDIIKHYGVLGMKWGIRRYQPYPKGKGHKGRFLGLKSRSQKRAAKKAEKERSKPPTKKSVKDMTDDELKEAVNRLNMEKRYRELTAKQKSRGQKLVVDILNDAAKQAASAYVKKSLNEYVQTEKKKKG